MEDQFLVFALQRNNLHRLNVANLIIVTSLLYLVYFLLVQLKSLYRRYQLAQTLDGPKAYPLIGNILSVCEKNNDSFYNNKTSRLIEKSAAINDDIVRLWVFHKLFILVKGPVHAQEILKNQSIRKTDFYRTIFGETALGQGILTNIDHNVWKKQRKIITPTFHFKILHTYIQYFFEESSLLCDIIGEDLKQSDEILLDMKLKMAGFDMIVRNVLGIQINAQRNPQHPFLLNIIRTMQITQRRIYQPWLLNDLLFRLSGLRTEQLKLTKEINAFMQTVIQKKREETKRNNNNETNEVKTKLDEKITGKNYESESVAKSYELLDIEYSFAKTKSFLELLLEIGQSADDRLTDAEILPELTTLFFAALDTTSTSNSTTLLLLAMHPQVLQKATEEVDSIFGGPDKDDGRKPTPADFSKMEYLECVIKESSRLYPAAPVIIRQVDEEFQLGKHVLPIGTSMIILIAAIHRNRNYYRSPKHFIPERFLPEEANNPKYFVQKHPYAYIPFSAGHRNCLGQKYAMLQMKTVISTILRRYTLSPTKFQTTKDIDRCIRMDITLRIEDGVVKFKRRKK